MNSDEDLFCLQICCPKDALKVAKPEPESEPVPFSFPKNFFFSSLTHTAAIVILSTYQYHLYGKRCPPALWMNRNSLQTILAGKQQPDLLDDFILYLESMPSTETRDMFQEFTGSQR